MFSDQYIERAADEADKRMADAEAALHAFFVDAVRAGRDVALPRPTAIGRNGNLPKPKLYPISDSLGETSQEGKALIFRACSLALQQAGEETSCLPLQLVQMREALIALVELEAQQYAEDEAEGLLP